MTLCAEVINNQPLKTEGILTHWNQTDLFFIHKKLQLTLPQGNVLMGTIDQSRKKEEGRQFKLEDHTRVLCGSNQVTVTKCVPLMRLWNSMLNGSLIHGDHVEIILIQNAEAKESGCIASGRYVIQTPEEIVGQKSIFQVDLAKAKGLERRYRLIGEYQDAREQLKQSTFLTLYEWDPAKQDYVLLGMQPVSTFNHIHSTCKLFSEVLVGLDSTNMDRFVLIKDEPNDDRKALLALKRIEKDLDGIRTAFLELQHLPLLQMLLSDFHEQRSEGRCLQILAAKASPILEMIKSVAQRYETDLQIKRTQEDILKQLMLEANYLNLVDSDDNGIISKSMSLLEQVCAHIDRMKDQDLIFFMGNTGSGKSTTISYFLEAELEKFSNEVGEKVIRMRGDDPGYPKIGQAIGTSETMYTQGYRHGNTKLMFVDCPGFGDTRGDDYELCANLSIDMAISGANRIPAIVVVIPLASITIDKGNPVLDLISLVQERFPFTFDPEKPENNERVFILFSKCNQVENGVKLKIKSGARFRMLMEEADRQIEKRLARGDAPTKFEVQQIEKRKKIWEMLSHMSTNRQIDFIDIDNKAEREKLIVKYSETLSSINKKEYVSSGEYMQRKFGNIVKMAAFSWYDRILSAYFYKVPEMIEEKKEELAKNEAKILDLTEEKANRLEQAEDHAKQINDLNQHLQNLEAYQADPSDDAMRQQLLKQASQLSNRSLKMTQDELKDVKDSIEKKNSELQAVEAYIQGLDEKCALTNAFISTLKEPLDKLQKENNVEVVNKSLISKIISDLKTVSLSIGVVTLGVSLPMYSKNRTVAIDFPLALMNIISSAIKSSHWFKLGLIFLLFRRYATGKGHVMRIEPMTVHFAADIKILKFQIDTQKKSLNDFQLKRVGDGTTNRGAIGKRDDLKTEIANLEKNKASLEEEIKSIGDTRALEQVAELSLSTKKMLKHTQDEYQKLINTQDLDDKIDRLNGEKAELKQSIHDLYLKLNNLEIVMTTQWESAKLLRKFAELITSTIDPNSKVEEPLLSCLNFIKLFDEKKDAVEALMKK
jgi:predicted GTPase/predicted  nucleic acid-binding Zn-ribbon protein